MPVFRVCFKAEKHRQECLWYRKILGFARLVRPANTLDVVKEDEPDNRILECAAEAGSEFIISADKDLLRLGNYAGAPIMTAADFLKRREERL